MHRIENLAKRLAKLEAVQRIEETPVVLELHRGSMTIKPADLARVFREIDGKTRGIPHEH